MYLWRELGVNSWPTFAIVGPNGRLLGQISGEGRRKVALYHLFLQSLCVIVNVMIVQII